MRSDRKVDAPELRQYAEDLLGVPARLHDYQWEGVSFLYRSHAALLADEMGLGKTVQTAVALVRWSYFVGQSEGIIKVDSEWL